MAPPMPFITHRTRGHYVISFQLQPTRCSVTQFINFCEMLYMFQAVPPPIIRSSKLFIPLLLPSTTVAGSSKGINIFELSDFMFQPNAPFFYYIYHIPLHVSSNNVLIIRSIHCIHTASGSLYVTLKQLSDLARI